MHVVVCIKEIKGTSVLIEFTKNKVRMVDLQKLFLNHPRLKDHAPSRILAHSFLEDGGINLGGKHFISGDTLYHMGSDYDPNFNLH